jgi:hypothetical protein
MMSATTASAITSPTELQSHSTVTIPFVFPAMMVTCQKVVIHCGE